MYFGRAVQAEGRVACDSPRRVCPYGDNRVPQVWYTQRGRHQGAVIEPSGSRLARQVEVVGRTVLEDEQAGWRWGAAPGGAAADGGDHDA